MSGNSDDRDLSRGGATKKDTVVTVDVRLATATDMNLDCICGYSKVDAQDGSQETFTDQECTTVDEVAKSVGPRPFTNGRESQCPRFMARLMLVDKPTFHALIGKLPHAVPSSEIEPVRCWIA